MPYIIGRSSYQRIDNQLQAKADPAQGADARKQARETLHKMATSMVGASGQVKRGYLKITTANEGALRLGTRWSTSADASTTDAVDFVKSLVEQGFRDHPGVNRMAVEEALASYTAKKGDRLGTHSFVKLVRDLESAAGISAKQDDRLLQARVKESAQLDSGDFELAPPSQPSLQMAQPQAKAQEVDQAAQPVSAAWTEADLRTEPQVHQRALTELRLGNYRAAAASLRAVQPPLSASDLARIVVNDHPNRRPATTRLVLFAQEAFRGREASAEEKAEFAFAAVTLPLRGDLKQPGLDPKGLSGLKDFAKLMLALQPDESKAVAQALADRVAQELPALESGEGFCAELRRIDPEQTIELDVSFSDIGVNIPKTLEDMDAYLDRFEADYPGTALARRAEKLQEDIGEVLDPDDPEDQRGLRRQLNDIKREVIKFVQLEPKLRGYIDEIARQAREHNAVQIHIPKHEYSHEISEVADRTADLCGARIEGSSGTAVSKATLSSFTSITNGGMKGAQWVGCVFNGVLDKVSFQGADLSGSDFTVTVLDNINAGMQAVNFAGAKLDDASIRIVYDGLREELDLKSSPGARQAALVRIMNHLDRTVHQDKGSPLTTIASIDDRYAELKVGLMRDALRFIVQENCLVALARPLEDVLARSPLFLADPEIRRLTAPPLSGR